MQYWEKSQNEIQDNMINERKYKRPHIRPLKWLSGHLAVLNKNTKQNVVSVWFCLYEIPRIGNSIQAK